MLLDVIYKLGEIRETVIQLDDDLLLYFLELATMQAKAKLTACLQPDIPKSREPAA